MRKTLFIGLCMMLFCLMGVSALDLYVNQSHSSCSDAGTRVAASSLATPWCGTDFSTITPKVLSGDTVYIIAGSNPRYNNRLKIEYYNLTSDVAYKAYPGDNVLLSRTINDSFYNLTKTWENYSASGSGARLWYANHSQTNPCVNAMRNDTKESLYPACNDSTICFGGVCPTSTYQNFTWFNNSLPYDSMWYNRTLGRIYLKLMSGENPNTVSYIVTAGNFNATTGYQQTVQLKNITGAGKLIIANLTILGSWIGVEFSTTGTTQPVNNLVLDNNTIIGGFRGVSTDGDSYNLTIKNNNFLFYQRNNWSWNDDHDMGSTGVWLDDIKTGVNITGNKFFGYSNQIVPRYTDDKGLPIDNFQGLQISYNTFDMCKDDCIEPEDYANCYNIHHNNFTNAHVVLTVSASNSSTCYSNFTYNIAIANLSQAIQSGQNRVFKLSGQNVNETTGWLIDHNTLQGDNGTMQYSNPPSSVGQLHNWTFTNNIVYSDKADKLLYLMGEERFGVYYNNNLYYKTSGYAFSYWLNDSKSTAYYNLSSAQAGGGWSNRSENRSEWGEPQFSGFYVPDYDSPACDLSTTGGYVGAVDCSPTPPSVNLLSPVNGSITNNDNPVFTFNFTDNDSSLANCSLFVESYRGYADSDTQLGTFTDRNLVDNYTYYNRTDYLNFSIPTTYNHGTLDYGISATLYSAPNCFSGDVLQTKIYQNISETDRLRVDCWNNTAWQRLQINYFDDEPPSVSEFYIDWLTSDDYFLVASNSSVINNTLTTFTSNTSLVNSDVLSYVTCYDTEGNLGTSSYVDFGVNTALPYITISSPVNGSNTSSNSMIISFDLLQYTDDSDVNYYFNISLLELDDDFIATIKGNNSKNLSYVWDGVLAGYSPGTYKIRVDAINSSSIVFASGESVYTIVTDAILNITANASGVLLSNFTITMSPGNSTSTTSGSVLVGIFKNYSYNVTISDSGYAITTLSGSWSSDLNYLTFNLSALANSLIITFKDQDNLSVLSGVNIFLDVIGDGFADNYSTSTGYLNVSGLLVDNYTLRYGSTTYSVRFYSVEVSDQSTQNVTLYLVLSSVSSNVTVTVIDQNANPVSGAVVKALKYDLASNSYLLQEVGTTNVAGESIFSLTLFDEYYKFMVEYDGNLKTITTPAYITSNSLTIQILLGDLVGESYYHYASLYTDLSVNTLTNNFRLDYDDTTGIVENVCLNVYTLGLLGETLFNTSCSSSASGTLLVSMLPINGTTYVGKAYYYEDGVSKFLASRTYTFPSVNVFGGVYALLLQLIVTVSVAFLAVWSIPLAAILVPLSLVIGKIIHINSFGWDAISAVIVIGFIIAYVTRKDR